MSLNSLNSLNLLKSFTFLLIPQMPCLLQYDESGCAMHIWIKAHFVADLSTSKQKVLAGELCIMLPALIVRGRSSSPSEFAVSGNAWASSQLHIEEVVEVYARLLLSPSGCPGFYKEDNSWSIIWTCKGMGDKVHL